MKEAELILVQELSHIYSTLQDKDNPTELMLELGKLKSINVYFSGQIEYQVLILFIRFLIYFQRLFKLEE